MPALEVTTKNIWVNLFRTGIKFRHLLYNNTTLKPCYIDLNSRKMNHHQCGPLVDVRDCPLPPPPFAIMRELSDMNLWNLQHTSPVTIYINIRWKLTDIVISWSAVNFWPPALHECDMQKIFSPDCESYGHRIIEHWVRLYIPHVWGTTSS